MCGRRACERENRGEIGEKSEIGLKSRPHKMKMNSNATRMCCSNGKLKVARLSEDKNFFKDKAGVLY